MADPLEESTPLITAGHLLLFDSSELAACVQAATGSAPGVDGGAMTVAGAMAELQGVAGVAAARAWHPLAREALARMEASAPVPGLASMVADLRDSEAAVAARLAAEDLAEQSETVRELARTASAPARAPVPVAAGGASTDLRVVHTLPTMTDVDPGGAIL